jgi:DNA polymerase-3 subunit alpha
MEEYLQETYGITVYQEQVMLLSQKLAGFTKGEADVLRKAMGKKIHALLAKLKPQFIEGGKANGHDPEKLEKIWKDWEAFASYAFNKSHSTCYAWIGYQTAYLKAHYPAEYMAAVLSNNMNDIKQVTFFMEECRRMGLNVLGPDVNESFYKFTVNDQQAIRFGMGAIKGVGRGAVETIIEHRKDARYTSVFDLTKRIDLRAANKKAIENLTLAGGLDSFGNYHRAQYFNPDGDGILFLEKAIRYGAKHQENLNSSQTNLFGDDSQEQIQEIKIPECESWGTLELLKKEKAVVGIYISAHPLDDFKREMKYFSSATFDILSDLDPLVNRDLSFGGIINDVEHLITKTGKGWGKFTIEDFSDQYEFKIFGEDYLKFRHFILPNNFVRLRLRVVEGWRNRETGQLGPARIQFNNFEMLHDTLKTNVKKITLMFEVKQLNESKIQDLKTLMSPYKGDKGLYVDVFDTEEKIKLTLPSRKQRVEVSNELLLALEERNIHYRLN